MAEANRHAASSKKRARAISDLNEEQIQHKRNVDRKAQRAFRQRTKDSIERLEQQVAHLQQTADEREDRFRQDLSTLQGSNSTLRQCLEQISELASTAVRSMVDGHMNSQPLDASQCMQGVADAESAEDADGAEDAEGAQGDEGAQGAQGDEGAAEGVEVARGAEVADTTSILDKPHSASLTPLENYNDVTATHDSYNAIGASHHGPSVSTPPVHQRRASLHMEHILQQQPPRDDTADHTVSYLHDRCSTMPISADAVYPSPSGSHQVSITSPQAAGSSHAKQDQLHLANDRFCLDSLLNPMGSDTRPIVDTPYSAPPNLVPRSIFTVLPSHAPSTCPLDEILHNFLHSQRDMIARGVAVDTVLGPPKPTVKALMDSSAANTVHALCGVMSEVLSTFAHVDQPEKLAFFYLMHKTMRVGDFKVVIPCCIG